MFPLPMAEQPPDLRSSSRRVVQRHRRKLLVTKVANQCLQSLNQLHYSFASPPLQVGASSLSRRLRDQVLAAADDYVGRLEPEAGSSCDGPLDFPSFRSDLELVYASKHCAVPLVAERVALPQVAATADLVSLLPSEVASRYMNPRSLLKPSVDPADVPKVRSKVSSDVLLKLVKRLHGIGMVTFLRRVHVVNGIFGVKKDIDKIRLILDARPANAHFVEPPKVELCTPDLISRLVASTPLPVYVFKMDQDNFYHRFRLPGWLVPYFAIPAVRAGDLGPEVYEKFGFGPEEHVFPCFLTLPMGWSHSVYVAQTAHLHFISSESDFREADMITSDNDFALDRPRHGLIIDDLFGFGTDPSSLSALRDSYKFRCPSAGLLVKPSKDVEPTLELTEVAGLEVDGVAKVVRLTARKMRRLVSFTAFVLERGQASGYEMSVLVGHWIWAALVRRPSFAVFGSVYVFIQKAGFKTFQLWPSVRRELRCVMGLAPLLFASWRAPFFDRVVATDASTGGLGVTATLASTRECLELAAQVGILPDDSSWDAPVPVGFANVHRWVTIASSRWRFDGEHINVLELRALLTGLRWVLSFPSSAGCRVVMLMDSAVVVGAVSKGRSSSYSLLVLLRRLSALCLAGGLIICPVWIPSESNPADGPSRG